MGPTRGWTRRWTGSGKELVSVEEAGARRLVELMALVLQGSLLVRHSPAYVADAFCASRLGDDAGWGHAFGTLPPGLDTAAIVSPSDATGTLTTLAGRVLVSV